MSREPTTRREAEAAVILLSGREPEQPPPIGLAILIFVAFALLGWALIRHISPARPAPPCPPAVRASPAQENQR